MDQMQLQRNIQRLKEALDKKDRAREEALRLSREITNISKKAIYLIHQEKFPPAVCLLASASKTNQKLKGALKDYPDLYYSGYIHNAQKELVEGMMLCAILTGMEIAVGLKNLDAEGLGVEPAAYLNGVGEVVGELHRHMQDLIIEHSTQSGFDRTKPIQQMFDWMEKILSFLVEFSQHDAVTGNLRYSVDIVRKIIKGARGTLLQFVTRERLIEKMEQNQSK